MRIKSFKFNGEDKVLFWCCFDIRRVMGAMVRTYQITMGRAYYKCTLRFSSTSNVTGTETRSEGQSGFLNVIAFSYYRCLIFLKFHNFYLEAVFFD